MSRVQEQGCRTEPVVGIAASDGGASGGNEIDLGTAMLCNMGKKAFSLSEKILFERSMKGWK